LCAVPGGFWPDVALDLPVANKWVELDGRGRGKAGHYRRTLGSSHGVEIADALIAGAAHMHGFVFAAHGATAR
jgi:hypothetical protein